VVWSTVAAACLTLAIVHLIIWLKQTSQRAHLLFSMTAVAVAAIAACELLAMHAQTSEQLGRILWWGHILVFFAVVSIVGFVRLHLHAGRPWLGYTVCVVRLLALIINIFSAPNLNHKEITGLRHLKIGGETISVAEGVSNPWCKVGELSSLLLLIFVADASITVWRRGNRAERRRAVVVGGSMTFLILAAAGHSDLVNAGLIQSPYLISLPFLAIAAAMGYELSSEVVRAAHLERDLEASEAALRESDARFRIMADTAPVMVWMSGADMLCNFFNKQWLEFTGRTMEEELGNGWLQGVHAEDLPHCLETYTSSFKARQPFTMEYRLRRADGEYRWILDNGVPRYTQEREFSGYIGSCIDITERIRAEEQLRLLRQELFHMARVSSMGELTSVLAHELSQPLMTILINAQAAQRLIDSGEAGMDEIGEILADIVVDDQRAAEVIRHLRGLLKRGELELEPLDINELIRGVERIIRSDVILNKVSVTLELTANLPEVLGGRIELQQVILNLMMNAIDAVRLVRAGARQITVRSKRVDAQTVCVAVEDSGPGVPPEAIEQVFKPFFTTKADGMGMGLSICRAIIEAHHGHIRTFDNPKGGATFEFVLPLVSEAAPQTGEM
jgi:two-component system, LuxR family, sensor kinase FixL